MHLIFKSMRVQEAPYFYYHSSKMSNKKRLADPKSAKIHFLFEGSFLYNCFFTYTTIPHTSDYPHPASLTSPGVYFLGFTDRLYGSQYGSSPTAKLWQEYAKADKRWGGADLSIIALELLTVFVAGPLALYICELVRQGDKTGKLWFSASVLATAELYGGKRSRPRRP